VGSNSVTGGSVMGGSETLSWEREAADADREPLSMSGLQPDRFSEPVPAIHRQASLSAASSARERYPMGTILLFHSFAAHMTIDSVDATPAKIGSD
jgi:hypothetical protein